MPGGTDDKPFRCGEFGCGQTFINEDHLNVHKLKHQMSLTLTPGTGNKFLFADQTPTPTKFLRYGEEIGLFNELTKNPFDEAFKSAAENVFKGKVSTPTAEADTLNTPIPHMPVHHHVRQPDTPDTPIKKRYRFLDPVTEPVPDCIPFPGPEVTSVPMHISQVVKEERRSIESSVGSVSAPASQESQASALQINDDNAFVPEISHEITTISATGTQVNQYDYSSGGSVGGIRSVESDSSSLMSPQSVQQSPSVGQATRARMSHSSTEVSLSAYSAEAVVQQHDVHVAPMQQVVSQANDINTHVNMRSFNEVEIPSVIEKTNVPILPVGSISTAMPMNLTGNSAGSSSSPTQYMLQVMIQTPEGKMMPVQIPAALANQPTVSSAKRVVLASGLSPRQQPQQPPTVVSNVGTTLTNASLLTKRKLKEAIQQNSPSGNKSFIASSPIVSRNASTSSSNPSTPMSANLQSPPPAVEYQAADSSVNMPSTYTMSYSDEDPDGKRKKFLERNRAAATRCRNKKKSWVQNLESKAEDLQANNTRLQSEVSQLRAEMAQLKALLLAHKDCPITIQQRNSGQLRLQRVPDSEMADAQMVPVRNMQTVTAIPTTVTKIAKQQEQYLQDLKPLAHVINVPQQAISVKNEMTNLSENIQQQYSYQTLQAGQIVTIPSGGTHVLPQGQIITVPTSTGKGQIVAVGLSQQFQGSDLSGVSVRTLQNIQTLRSINL